MTCCWHKRGASDDSRKGQRGESPGETTTAMTKKLAVIKIANPKEGVSREEYERICVTLGVRPKPPKAPVADAK